MKKLLLTTILLASLTSCSDVPKDYQPLIGKNVKITFDGGEAQYGYLQEDGTLKRNGRLVIVSWDKVTTVRGRIKLLGEGLDGLSFLWYNTHMRKNTIQIWGLKKSGTNFLEWSMVRNFPEVGYFNSYPDNAYFAKFPEHRHKGRMALKHYPPSLEFGEKGIIYIYREYDLWEESVTREFPRDRKEDWQEYLDLVHTLDEEKTLILQHKWCVDNFEAMLQTIADKFNLTMPDEPIQPMKRLNQEGAKAKETEEDYNPQ